ncbi:hypothetical protein [Aquabacterium parvum]|uniref:hypothetical protein n=1 Tax=Aquabacterium parvum TaxID=70584 RepID=UPI000718E102|nr:hypothetical protein [Aquabacterium parvum]
MASTLARGGWHRPISLKSLLIVGGLVLLVWLALMLGAVWFVYTQLDARMDLHEQPVTLQLPAGLQAQASVQRPVSTRIDLRPLVSVPVRQRLRAQIEDSLLTRTSLQTLVQIDTVVQVDQVVPVQTELSMRVPLFSWLPAFDVSLPVTLNVPFKASVPVRAQVPVSLDALVSGELKAPVEVPLEAVFQLRPHVKADLQAQLHGQMDFVVRETMPALPLTIVRARLLVPFDVPSIRQRERP